jgi:hypothetical protein
MTEVYLGYTWNIPFFSYSRYIPGIFRSYTTDGHMTGIYLVYSQDLQFLGISDVCLCFLSGRVQGPVEIRSYCAYCAYFLFSNCRSTSAWVDQCQSAIVYERREQAQVVYVIPVYSILGRLPLVPVGATGTIPFAMRRESADFPGAFCEKSANGRDGCRWWYVNSWALGWGTKQ